MARKWISLLALSAVPLTAAAPMALAEEDVMPPFVGDADNLRQPLPDLPVYSVPD